MHGSALLSQPWVECNLNLARATSVGATSCKIPCLIVHQKEARFLTGCALVTSSNALQPEGGSELRNGACCRPFECDGTRHHHLSLVNSFAGQFGLWTSRPRVGFLGAVSTLLPSRSLRNGDGHGHCCAHVVTLPLSPLLSRFPTAVDEKQVLVMSLKFSTGFGVVCTPKIVCPF